ncbi:hypothetical protein PAECIP111892_01353 [Paenibacillus auburnensis]|uniref:DUF4279 domain-containing protein n=1 Tax=Paenibacillus auburnensis TaxID=2905649 RepID=A0ABN8FWS9_9BACL|nr:hypothetical protein PAECIP111892_01353 [Paenibacillus auburnensis]
MNFEEITTNINLQPVKIKRKGEPITSKQVMKDDYWSYKVKFGDRHFDTALDSFLNDLMPSEKYIKRISMKHEVYIFFSTRSRLGQMGFELKPNVLRVMADLNIRFEVHVLSNGEAENE